MQIKFKRWVINHKKDATNASGRNYLPRGHRSVYIGNTKNERNTCSTIAVYVFYLFFIRFCLEVNKYNTIFFVDHHKYTCVNSCHFSKSALFYIYLFSLLCSDLNGLPPPDACMCMLRYKLCAVCSVIVILRWSVRNYKNVYNFIF